LYFALKPKTRPDNAYLKILAKNKFGLVPRVVYMDEDEAAALDNAERHALEYFVDPGSGCHK
jgi:hypothetical protein